MKANGARKRKKIENYSPTSDRCRCRFFHFLHLERRKKIWEQPKRPCCLLLGRRPSLLRSPLLSPQPSPGQRLPPPPRAASPPPSAAPSSVPERPRGLVTRKKMSLAAF